MVDYYTTQETAEKLRVCNRSIRNMINDKRIPAIKIDGKGKWLIPKRWVDGLAGEKQEIQA